MLVMNPGFLFSKHTFRFQISLLEDSPPTTIDGVLHELDRIIEKCIAENDARGIFAYVYRRTTAEIKTAIESDDFDDGPSLERFDVAFANYYLRAYRDYEKGETCSLVWERSFVSCKDRLAVAQHILLGMNAHINLDLGLTTATLARGRNIEDFKRDFVKVNDVLQRIINELQDSLSRVSPLFFLVDWLGQNTDEKWIDFSMRQARNQAWNLACLLHNTDDNAFSKIENTADKTYALFAQKMARPNSRLLRWVLGLVRRFEGKEVGRVIEGMSHKNKINIKIFNRKNL